MEAPKSITLEIDMNNAVRSFKQETIQSNFAIIGGGLAGVCAALTAARGGSTVTLVQDRPVLGGNASSEVRLWALGATSHMGNNNRWSREGGVIDELLTENLYRNPEGNPVIFDTVLLDAVLAEKNITLLLNTAVDACIMNDERTRIVSVSGFNRQNETRYEIQAPLFCDCTGDGTVGFLAGADFIMGRADTDEKDALQYPESFGELLGSTIFFYTKNTGKSVQYIAPDFALKDISKLKRISHISAAAQGCDYWWIEWGGTKDTIHDSEQIKFSLWQIVYGIWDYVKNSGKFPEADTLTLEWVGCIPGKRESRRFLGDYTLVQQDLVEQRRHEDVVSFGGWALDHHPAEGAYSSDYAPCYQWHGKGVYGIPYRTMYSRNIENLFMSGRLISVSRAAFGSTRVMMTCAHNAQAVGAASVVCRRREILPRDIATDKKTIAALQQYLLRDGQYIPFVPSVDLAINKALQAKVSASSEYAFCGFLPDGDYRALEHSAALIVPVRAGAIPAFSVEVDAAHADTLHVEVRASSRAGNFTPDVTLDSIKVPVAAGKGTYDISSKASVAEEGYVFLCFMANERISLRHSRGLVSGVTTVYNKFDKKVAKSAVQNPPKDIGVDSFEFWTPYRRPFAQNIAVWSKEPFYVFAAANTQNGLHRPAVCANAWVSDPADSNPRITLAWDTPQSLSVLLLFFDTDYDFAMESVQMQHPERVLPYCVTEYKIYDEHGVMLYEKTGNRHARNKVALSTTTKKLIIELCAVAGNSPPALFGVQCW